MIADSQNKALLIVAEKAKLVEKWNKYYHYCILREKGLRKASFAVLSEFLNEVKQWNYEEKKAFVIFLMALCDVVPDADYGPMPMFLRQSLIKPTLLTWCEQERLDSAPFRWLGHYFSEIQYLYKAVEIDVSDDKARSYIVSFLVGHIDYATHHLPDYYIGEPKEAVKLAEEIQMHTKQFTKEEQREYWTRELAEAMLLVNSYIEWKSSGHPNLALWGKENNRVVGSGITTIYYTK